MNVRVLPSVELDALCHSNPDRYPFLIESVAHNSRNRFSILFAHPQEKISLNQGDAFDFLARLESKITPNSAHPELPFTGGWFVFLSYELIGQIEPSLAADLHASDLPRAIAVRVPCAIIHDHQTAQTYLIDEDDNPRRISAVLRDIDALRAPPNADFSGQMTHEPDAYFLKNVIKIKALIKAGDVFQVNLSRQWQYQLDANISPAQIYRALKKTNPAPFSALAQFDEFSIISSSPERLFSVQNGVVQTRPIAGTQPRGKNTKMQDEALKARLKQHPKEQAEHIMLLDLERNDLGKVCEYGSIRVSEMMTLETYPFVHHLVSNIQGKLKPGTQIGALVRALFPGGTITGCPKIRCMQIIAQLEQKPRQAYTGSLGYVSNNGNMDFNILIRTVIKRQKNLTFRVGAGIVFDSKPERELAEIGHKARGILQLFD